MQRIVIMIALIVTGISALFMNRPEVFGTMFSSVTIMILTTYVEVDFGRFLKIAIGGIYSALFVMSMNEIIANTQNVEYCVSLVVLGIVSMENLIVNLKR